MTMLIWEHNNIIVSDPVNLGSFEELDISEEQEIIIRHDSNSEISDCGFYIEPFKGEYTGSHSPVKDYERVLWYGNNYPGYGISLIQRYTVTGVIDDHNGVRLADYERSEQKDIFKGQEMEILSGDSLGEKAVISSYNPSSQNFTIEGDFTSNISGQNYRIAIRDEQIFTTKNGSSYYYTIPLIYRAGIIERLGSVTVHLKVKIPKFALSAGKHLFDLNMEYTSIEG